MSGSDIKDIDISSSKSNNENSINQRHVNKKKIVLMRMATINVATYFLTHVVKNSCRTSTLTGHQWVQEIYMGIMFVVMNSLG